MAAFQFGAHIGSGGFGAVEEAVRVDDAGRKQPGFARKRLLDEWLDDKDAVERFRREVRLLGEMDHPNILPIVGRNLSDRPPWFVMPFAETNLAGMLPRIAGDAEQVCALFEAVLTGMAYAHGAHVVHRDLKPENVLIVNGVPMVGDFGLGRRIDSSSAQLTRSNEGMGTTAYMAPEQFTDAKHVGPPADVYALGKLLWEMLSGRRPVVGRPNLDHVPDRFRSFIDRCTEEDQADRFTSAADALVAFQILVSGEAADSYVGVDLEAMLRGWEKAGGDPHGRIVDAIAKTLVARQDDEEMYFRVVPRLPLLLIRQLVDDHPDEFSVILHAYNDHIGGGLPYEYCGVVANFYRFVFSETESFDLRLLMLTRLIDLGPSQNHERVGVVTGELLEKVTDTRLADAVAYELRKDTRRAMWVAAYADDPNHLATALRDAFAFAEETPFDY